MNESNKSCQRSASVRCEWCGNTKASIRRIGCVPQTLLLWVQRHEVDSAVRDGASTAAARRIKEFEREVKELRQASEILGMASSFSPRRSSTADSGY